MFKNSWKFKIGKGVLSYSLASNYQSKVTETILHDLTGRKWYLCRPLSLSENLTTVVIHYVCCKQLDLSNEPELIYLQITDRKLSTCEKGHLNNVNNQKKFLLKNNNVIMRKELQM